MDYTAIATAVVSGVLGIGAVAVWLGKVVPKVAKYAGIAKDAVETLSDLADALKPDPATGKVELTPEEIAKLNADIAAFKLALKA